MCQKTLLLASVIVTIGAFGGGFGVGYFWGPRRQAPVEAAPRPEPENAQAKPKLPAPPDGVRLERLKDIDAMVNGGGTSVVALKFSGNRYVKFWAETETNGERRQVLEVTSQPFFGFDGKIPHNEGDFVWIRSRWETPGREGWHMSLRTKNGWSGGNMPAYLFDKPGETTIKSYGAMKPAVAFDLPTPLPLDRDICIQEVREISDKGERTLLAANASIVGFACLPSVHPLAASAAIMTPKPMGICTVRLMCKVLPMNP